MGRSFFDCHSSTLLLDGQLQVGGVLAAGVDDVLPAVGRGVLADGGHHRSQKAPSADDEAELFARVEREADREQIDLDRDDLTG